MASPRRGTDGFGSHLWTPLPNEGSAVSPRVPELARQSSWPFPFISGVVSQKIFSKGDPTLFRLAVHIFRGSFRIYDQ